LPDIVGNCLQKAGPGPVMRTDGGER